ncbi:MAG: CAAD domain-containing protein [Oculatellaceae cyanobacterium Prado106]|jgi:hypothetical protein|nr:CAAD domain-containing protein [Oculatellaceae cyanobacterium Prado106]
MEPEVKQVNPSEYVAEKLSVNINNNEESGNLAPFSSDSSKEQWKEIGEKVSTIISELPDYVSEFFGEYRRPIILVAVVLSSIVALKLLFAVLGAINDIPLLSPIFELVGVSYSAWFVYRYVLKESTRKELTEGLTALKEQVLGKSSEG